MYVPNSLQWIHALLWSCQIPSKPAPRETYIWSWHLKDCTYISMAIWTRPLAHATQTATNFGTSVCADGGNHLDSSESSISTSLPSKECWVQVYCNDVSMPKPCAEHVDDYHICSVQRQPQLLQAIMAVPDFCPGQHAHPYRTYLW